MGDVLLVGVHSDGKLNLRCYYPTLITSRSAAFIVGTTTACAECCGSASLPTE